MSTPEPTWSNRWAGRRSCTSSSHLMPLPPWNCGSWLPRADEWSRVNRSRCTSGATACTSSIRRRKLASISHPEGRAHPQGRRGPQDGASRSVREQGSRTPPGSTRVARWGHHDPFGDRSRAAPPSRRGSRGPSPGPVGRPWTASPSVPRPRATPFPEVPDAQPRDRSRHGLLGPRIQRCDSLKRPAPTLPKHPESDYVQARGGPHGGVSSSLAPRPFRLGGLFNPATQGPRFRRSQGKRSGPRCPPPTGFRARLGETG